MTKAIPLYEVSIPGNAELMLQEVRKLIDFEMLKPDSIASLLKIDFNLADFLGEEKPKPD